MEQLLQVVLPKAMNIQNDIYLNNPMRHPGYLFSRWIGGALMGAQPFLYYLLIPILAVLPYADSFYQDEKSGYAKSILSRTDKKYYYTAKYTSVFLSGGSAVVIPLLINLGASALLLPALRPQVSTSFFAINASSMWGDLFYSHPFLYVFLFLAIDFVFSGFLATIALIVSFFVEHRFIVLFSPFLVYLFFYSLFTFLGLDSWVPIYFLKPGSGFGRFSVILLETAVLAVCTFTIFFAYGLRNDID